MKLKLKIYLVSLIVLLLSVFVFFKIIDSKNDNNHVSFAVLADPRSGSESWQNSLSFISHRNTIQEKTAPINFVLVTGDMDPIKERYQEFKDRFSGKKANTLFLPVVGNHEFDDKGIHFNFIKDYILPLIPGIQLRANDSCDYYVDINNTRVIVVDGYSKLGHNGVINQEGRNWVDKAIKSAPSQINDIFIAFHEPAFPRYSHLTDSFNADPEQRNEFWNLLLKYKKKVKAVFVGHTHYYYKLKIKQPEGRDANNASLFPDEVGGIYQIDAGSAGNGLKNTVVMVDVDQNNISYNVFQAENGFNKEFMKVDSF